MDKQLVTLQDKGKHEIASYDPFKQIRTKMTAQKTKFLLT